MFCILIVLLRKFETFIPGNGETVDVMCAIWATASRPTALMLARSLYHRMELISMSGFQRS